MKRIDLVRKIEQAGCCLIRNAGRHRFLAIVKSRNSWQSTSSGD